MKKVGLILAVVLVVVCGGGLYALRNAMSQKRDTGPKPIEVERGDLAVQVVETGTVDAVKAVEVKSRVAGRIVQIFVDEGSVVKIGDVIAVIDPQETQFRVEQDRAQLRGAQSAVARTSIEIQQRRVTAKSGVDRAKMRVAQLEKELEAQPTLTRTQIEAADTAYNTAVQARDQLVTTTQPNERTEAQSSVREAEANEANARQELQRRRNLLEKGYVALKSVEDAQLQMALAATRLQSARDRLSRLEGQQAIERRQADERVRQGKGEPGGGKANSIQDDIKRKEYESALSALEEARANLRDVQVLERSRDQSRATVDQLQSVLRDSERLLGESDILSPISGVVTKKLIQVGELVSSLSSFSSGTPIVRIEDRREMLVQLDINEIDVAKLKPGLEAEVTVDALPDRVFKGRIYRISPASKTTGAESQPNGQSSPVVKYGVEIRIEGGDVRLNSGMSAKCVMDAVRVKNVLKVPAEYVGVKDGKAYLAIKPETATSTDADRVYVKTGLETASSVEIVSGVSAGTKIYKPLFRGPKRKGAQFGPDEEN